MKTKNRIKKAIPTLNVRLLRKVQKHILEEPRRIAMSILDKRADPGSSVDLDEGIMEVPECGTIACIAGWTNILAGNGEFADATDAEESLGFPHFGLCELFYVSRWPKEFLLKYNRSRTAKRRANVTSDRIDYFIVEGK